MYDSSLACLLHVQSEAATLESYFKSHFQFPATWNAIQAVVQLYIHPALFLCQTHLSPSVSLVRSALIGRGGKSVDRIINLYP